MESEDIELSKLFCTFTEENNIDDVLFEIQHKYTVLFSKVFILMSVDTDEAMLTYNIDTNNLNDQSLIENTILVHRKKSSNTLYTINSLNILISSLNNGKHDHNYQINWNDYRNSMLLTREGEFIKLNTRLQQIINLN